MRSLHQVCLLSILVTSIHSLPLTDQTGSSKQGDDLGELLKVGAGVLESLLAILGPKVEFVTKLLTDRVNQNEQEGSEYQKNYWFDRFSDIYMEELQTGLATTVSVGANLTGEVARVALPVAQGLLQVAPVIIETGSQLVGSVATAASATLPLVLEIGSVKKNQLSGTSSSGRPAT